MAANPILSRGVVCASSCPISMHQVPLEEALSRAIRQDVDLVVRHVAGAPTPCPPIFSPPLGEPAETTVCKEHFLTVSINPDPACKQGSEEGVSGDGELLVFAIEVLVYTTDKLSTLFVSKADSTGYLSLLNRNPDSPAAYSLIKDVLNVFLYHLVSIYHKPDVKLVLSLFARAQDQYLFPGSSDNKGKHILDDRNLIKWWCRVIERVMQSIEQDSGNAEVKPSPFMQKVTSHLIVPGCDTFETRNFLPTNERASKGTGVRWRLDYPLHQICSYPDAPPRCLVPRFPDDPKARFLIDLDDEITEDDPPHGFKNSGKWFSVKTLDQFWEMMSFRQECSAGRLVGFLWMIVQPSVSSIQPGTTDRSTTGKIKNGNGEAGVEDATERLLLASTGNDCDKSMIHVSHCDYKVLGDYLLELDFSNQHDATINTKLWVERLSSLAGSDTRGMKISGKRPPAPASQPVPLNSTPGTVQETNVLGDGLIRKRKRQGEVVDVPSNGNSKSQQTQHSQQAQPASSAPAVNVLGSNLIRKKRK